jgi:soluble lytic murein transglycosylase-like protein
MLIEQVHQNSRAYGYDPRLVLAVIHVESVFDADALGRYKDGNYSGAMGLMQLKFETAQEVARDLEISLESIDDLFIPEINIALGVAYLTRLIAKFNSLKLGILAYNQGPGIILESISGKRPLSVRYYNKVLKSYYMMKHMHRKGHRNGL